MGNQAFLFSGAGGTNLGFKQAGFSAIFANDFDNDAYETYKKIDVLTAGFPCQGFSIAGHQKRFSDERGSLILELLGN